MRPRQSPSATIKPAQVTNHAIRHVHHGALTGAHLASWRAVKKRGVALRTVAQAELASERLHWKKLAEARQGARRR